MIWFHDKGSTSGPFKAPEWNTPTQPLDPKEEVSSIVIGEPIVTTPKAPEVKTPPKPTVTAAPPKPEPPTLPPVDPKVEQQLMLLANAINATIQTKEEMEHRDIEYAVHLGFEIAQQLVCGAIQTDPKMVLEIVKEALGLLDEKENTRIRLHPAIIEALEKSESLKSFSEIPNIEVVADPNVEQMGCIVEGEHRKVNGQVQSRLERLKVLFKESQGGDV